MIKINRKVEYALMCLKHMGSLHSEELTSARELCDLYHMPFDTVSKVMQQMNSVQILHSVKGVKGGYTLAKPLSQITYMELSELIEGKSFEMKCESNHGGPCELINTCNIISPVQKINFHVAGLFKELTLEELLMKAS
ncbi:MAG: RrF2 family transcriptional regulator [Bacteriovoracaceae bacterium]